ncbi:MAG TPA: rod shape-determining protein MreC [Bryobacteraceae bacterium]|nr:rod shape-determining protein MreC [Bryobacteraceae bacterium]
MEALFNRYRNVAALVVAIVAQLMLLAYQIKSNGEVRLIRVWAVSAVTPVARGMEAGRSGVAHFLRDYFFLLDVRSQNQRLQTDLDRARLENQFLRNELSTADRAKSLAIFQQQSPSRTVAAHVIGNTTGVGAKVVIVDRGSNSGIEKGMAVITPDGIVGKITSVFPTASYMLLITDPTFAAGVLSQKNRVRGTVKGQGYGTVTIDYVQNEEKVDQDEWFYTSGDDRIFPKGLPVGQAAVVRAGKARKEIYVNPSGLQNGLEEVLIVVDGVHRALPEISAGDQPVHLLDPPPGEDGAAAVPVESGPQTDADRLVDRYRKIGEAQKHVYGEHGGGAPNFNINVDPAPALPGAVPQAPSGAPQASKPPAPVAQ